MTSASLISLVWLLTMSAAFIPVAQAEPDQDLIRQLEGHLCAKPENNEVQTEAAVPCVTCLSQSQPNPVSAEGLVIAEMVRKQERTHNELAFFKLIRDRRLWAGDGQDLEGDSAYDLEVAIKLNKEKSAELKKKIAGYKNLADVNKKLKDKKRPDQTQRSLLAQYLQTRKAELQPELEKSAKDLARVQRFSAANPGNAQVENTLKGAQRESERLQGISKKVTDLEAWLQQGGTGTAPATVSDISANALVADEGPRLEAELAKAKQEIRDTKKLLAEVKKKKDYSKYDKPETEQKELEDFEKANLSTFTNIKKKYPNAEKCGMSTAEIVALRLYTKSGYSYLNGSIRRGGEDAKEAEPFRKVLASALNKLRPYEGMVNRGTDLPPDVLETYKVGEVVEAPAFTSTSVADGYGRKHHFVIHSKNGVYVAPYSANDNEFEVLLPQTKFKVLDRQNLRDGKVNIVLEEVP